MTRSTKLSISGVLALLVLAACGSGGAGNAAAQFGNAFLAAFRASDTAEPVEPSTITYRNVADSNVDAALTQEPVNF